MSRFFLTGVSKKPIKNIQTKYIDYIFLFVIDDDFDVLYLSFSTSNNWLTFITK